jgi:crotonobetainyl-CoA:carnitine CoA-transferase CaiB-like acyl-CoA transferase
VLELGSIVAAPFATRLLAEMGAEVLKVEPPQSGDPLRNWGLMTDQGSLFFLVQARNKKSLAIDLKRPEGQDLVRGLAQKVDVLVENFTPGRLESWNLAPDDLRELNPQLVVVRISGFGQTGPYKDRPGFGNTGESMGGIRYITGHPDRPPLRVPVSLGDTLAGLYATIGALAALYRRGRAGAGETVDVALYEAVFTLLEGMLAEYSHAGVVRERVGNLLPTTAPSNTYPTADDRFIAIGANTDSIFRRFCVAIDRPELADDPRFAGNQSRVANVAIIDEIIEGWTRERSLAAIWELLNAAKVPASPVYSVADIANDPHYRARQMVREADAPGQLGTLLVPGLVPRFEDAPTTVNWLGPALGAHTAQVLEEDLGLEPEEVERLANAGVVGLV